MESLIERYSEKISGVISCPDRVVIYGTLPQICYAGGMTSYLYKSGIRIFDYTKLVEPLKNKIRSNAERLAADNGLEIEFIRKLRSFRKEERIKEIVKERGSHPGLVHIFSAMESCPSYTPWHDKKKGNTFLKSASGRCLHYYFYFIDEEYGLCYLRVPTWCPFRLQFYFNGHNWLARRLDKEGIGYRLCENAFLRIDDWEKAQQLAEGLDVRRLHHTLDRFAKKYCPAIEYFDQDYHWSLMQTEYALDIVFKRQSDLEPIYENITRRAVLDVKADNIATFLGRKITGAFNDEAGNDFSTRISGTRIKHHLGPVSIKMYDKFGLILRIETTVNKVSYFKHHRKVEHRDGTSSYKLAPLKKSIYSLRDLTKLMRAANHRYLAFISEIDDFTAGMKRLEKVTRSKSDNKGRNYKGFNFFYSPDRKLFEIILRGEHTISGLRNKDIRKYFPDLSAGQVSRILKRLRLHGMIKRIGRTYKYYTTNLGRKVMLTGLKIRNLVIIPELAQA
ncbi:MarR family transcriptional regulator [bacterium]|nr:MarR family transcriptional regulator [bacterium]